MAEPKLVSQSGTRFLVDCGDKGPDGLAEEWCVYDRPAHVLYPASNPSSLLARGYWSDVTIDADTAARIVAEVVALMPPDAAAIAAEIERLKGLGLTDEQATTLANETQLDVVFGASDAPVEQPPSR